jgi:hypothetical protein
VVTKLTVRIPERVAARLRERSTADGHSLNETLVRALERGLDQPAGEDDEWWRDLGDLIERPVEQRVDPEEIDRLTRGLHHGRGSILDDLDWTRGER